MDDENMTVEKLTARELNQVRMVLVSLRTNMKQLNDQANNLKQYDTWLTDWEKRLEKELSTIRGTEEV